METEELKEILVKQSGIKSDSFDIEEGKLLLHINMTDISLPEGECENFILFFEPLLSKCSANGINFFETQLVFNHPFEANMLLINGEWWFHEAHKLAANYQIPENQVTIITGNWKIFWLYQKWHRAYWSRKPMFNLEAHMQMLWCYAPHIYNGDSTGEGGVFDQWGDTMEFDYCDPAEPKQLTHTFNTLNRVPRRNRMHLYKVLKDNDLLKNGLCSFNEVGYADMIGMMPDDYIRDLPLTLDKPDGITAAQWIYDQVNRHQYYPDVTKHDNMYAPILNNSLVSVVAETCGGTPERIPEDWPNSEWYFYWEEGFITEKTFRTIANGHPVIWVAEHGTTKVMQRLGFKTYSEFWDESYDAIRDPVDRINAVTDLIKQLSELNAQEKQDLWQRMVPTLQHNQQLILNLKQIPRLTWADYHEYLKYNI
ncbi:hypothetical protein N9C44_00750 [bacterium]|jgi:hypothetical protein|nr:hypothetical protein [bacterium]